MLFRFITFQHIFFVNIEKVLLFDTATRNAGDNNTHGQCTTRDLGT